MKRNLPIQIPAAVALGSLGVSVMLGWALHLAPVVQYRTNSLALVFGSALCIALAGIALLLPLIHAGRARQAQAAIGWVLIAITSLNLLGGVLGIALLVDLPALHAWMHDLNPRPGKMTVNTGIGLMLAGFVFVAMARVQSRTAGTSVLAATFAILILGIGGVAGNVLDLLLIYPQVSFLRIEAQATAGIEAAGL